MSRSKGVYASEGFLELRRQWYEKLASSGFADLEYTDWRNGESLSVFRGQQPDLRSYRPETERYFALARQWVHRLEQEDAAPRVKLVWSLHAEGMKNREIEREYGIGRETCRAIVKREARRLLEALQAGQLED